MDRNINKLFNIDIIKKDFLIPDFIQRLDLSRDIVFSFPTNFNNLVGFSYSGLIQFSVGEDMNLSIVRSRSIANSPIRIYKNRFPFKFCAPCGISPIFLKPNNSKAITHINATYENFFDLKINDKQDNRKNSSITPTVIYENIEIESSFNRDLLILDYPSLIIPKTYRLFDLLLSQTIFSTTLTLGRLYVVYNDEFFNNFKEAI